MPESYRPPLRKDEKEARTRSQSLDTNTTRADATVRDVLAAKDTAVHTITPDETLLDAVETLRAHGIGALVVVADGGALAGILSERDIVRKLADAPGETLPQTVAEVMTREVETCTPDEPLVSVLTRMTEGRFRHMPVMTDGSLSGVISIGDAVHFRLKQLEHEALQMKQLIVG